MIFIKKIFFLLVLCFFSNAFFAQETIVSGYVFDENDEPIPNANLMVNGFVTDTIITYSISDQKGEFLLNIPFSKPSTVLIKVKAIGYDNYFKKIEIDSIKVYDNEIFTLSKSKVNQLEEVYIEAERRKVKTRKDTTTYRINEFRDGTERTVEDALKNLPGIQISEDGEIKFKGREIESVLLGGDNLFGNNYTIGTKNISVDLIEEVEAIERYSENPVLSGLEYSDKVALNLRLKENQIDFSGNATLGIGHESRYYADITGLAISKKAKNFSNFHYNNVGSNTSPYSSSPNISSLDDTKNKELKGDFILNKPIYTSSIKRKNVLKNNNLYTSTNQIINISKQTKLRFNLSYFEDLAKTQTDQTSFYFSEMDTTSFTQQNKMRSKPQVMSGSYKMTWNPSKKSQLDVNGQIDFVKKKTNFDYILNQSANSLANDQEEIFILQNLNYTTKLDQNNAIQVKGKLSMNELPEEDIYSNQLIIGNKTYKNQLVFQSNKQINTEVLWVGAKNKFKYSGGLDFQYKAEKLNTDLQNTTSATDDIRNKIALNSLRTGIKNSLNYFYKKWLFRFNTKLSYLLSDYKPRLLQNHKASISKIIFNPDLMIRHRFNSKSNIEGQYRYQEKMLPISSLYSQPLLSDNTSLNSNTVDLQTLKSQEANIQYRYDDVFNAFELWILIRYGENFNPVIPRINISENLIFSDFFISQASNQNYKLAVEAEKLVYDLSSKFKFGIDASRTDYYNQINTSDLRLNKLNQYSFKFDYISVFDKVFNFGNSFKYVINHTTNVDKKISNKYLTNSLDIIIRPQERLYAKISFDFYVPDINKIDENFLISNASLNYSTKNKKM
ncbi:MAG: hypothetical protein ACTHYV_01500, partial [Psychroflexus sp.]